MTNCNVADTKTPTILVMAGGTGGHIFPGLAVAQKLKNEGWHIHWLGTADRMEAEIIPENGFDISFISISGLRNKNIIAWIKLPFKMISALWQAIKVIRKIQPNVVLGMGGYASAPGGFAAWLLQKPLVIHEQNAAAGLTNRILARIATKVCCAFPNAFANNIAAQVVGNPLRASISEYTQQVSNNEEVIKTSHNILIMGGSLGAQVLNEIAPQCFGELVKNTCETKQGILPINVWHQTGKGKHHQVITAYNQHHVDNKQVRVSEFINDMGKAYQWADVVICRAGALTVSELAMAAKPAIFIPLPHAVDDHQTKNAQYLVCRGAGILIKQSELTSRVLTQHLSALFSEPQTLKQMAKSAFAAADVAATNNVADICQQLATAKLRK